MAEADFGKMAKRAKTDGAEIPQSDREILRELAKRKVEIGNLPVQKEKFDLWNKLNKLEETRPLVWINELPWDELEPHLGMSCESAGGQKLEREFRREQYQWDHFACDMVVEPIYYANVIGGPTSTYADFGIEEQVVEQEGGHDKQFIPIIHSLEDADQIRTPEVWVDEEATADNQTILNEIFDGVMEIRTRGIVHQWHSPWDQIIHWYGIEQLYMDMYENPELIHRIMTNFSKAWNEVVDKQTALGMLDVGSGNWRVGSGGMAICDELPSENKDGHCVTPKETWGCGVAQIFSEVSPEMHEEFSLKYERPHMERYGLTYYGCCEPLHRKMDQLRTVKNLRKISMSPWIDVDMASEQLAADYVFSYKPSPAVMATDSFHEDEVRAGLKDVLERTKKNRCEIILKDVTTIRDDPARMSRWAEMVMEEVESL